MVDRIRSLCRMRGTNIKNLERVAGLGNGTIRRWDVNTPSIDKIQAVAKVLGVTINDILDEQREIPAHVMDENSQKLFDLIMALPVEQRDREIAYLRSLIGQDKS